MEALIYFALWAAMIFAMMRLMCGAYVMGLGHLGGRSEAELDGDSRAAGAWHPPAHLRDPVCGRRVATHDAKTSVFDGEVYFFCSRDCREVFETMAEIYVDGPPPHRRRPQAAPRV